MKLKTIEVAYRVGALRPDGVPQWKTDIVRNLITEWGMNNLSNYWFADMTKYVLLGVDGTPNRIPLVGTHSGNTVTTTTGVFKPEHATVPTGIMFNSGSYVNIIQYLNPQSVRVDSTVGTNTNNEAGILCITSHDTIDDLLVGSTYVKSGCKNTIEPITESNGESYLLLGNTRGVTFNNVSGILTNAQGRLIQDIRFKEIGWAPSIATGMPKVFGRRVEDIYFSAGEIPYVEVTIYRKIPTGSMNNGLVGIAESAVQNKIGIYRATSEFKFGDIWNSDSTETSELWKFASKVDISDDKFGDTVVPEYAETLLEGVGGGKRYFILETSAANLVSGHSITYPDNMRKFSPPIRTSHGKVLEDIEIDKSLLTNIAFKAVCPNSNTILRVRTNGNRATWARGMDGKWASTLDNTPTYTGGQQAVSAQETRRDTSRFAYTKILVGQVITGCISSDLSVSPPKVYSHNNAYVVAIDGAYAIVHIVSNGDIARIHVATSTGASKTYALSTVAYTGANISNNQLLAAGGIFQHISGLDDNRVVVLKASVLYCTSNPTADIPAIAAGNIPSTVPSISTFGVFTGSIVTGDIRTRGSHVFVWDTAFVHIWDFSTSIPAYYKCKVIADVNGLAWIKDARVFGNLLVVTHGYDAGYDTVVIYGGAGYTIPMEMFNIEKDASLGMLSDGAIAIAGNQSLTTYRNKYNLTSGAIVDYREKIDLNDLHDYFSGQKIVSVQDAWTPGTYHTFTVATGGDVPNAVNHIHVAVQTKGTVAPGNMPTYISMFSTTLSKVEDSIVSYGIELDNNAMDNFGIATYWTRLNGSKLGIAKPVWKEWAGYSGYNSIPNVTPVEIGYAGSCEWQYDRVKVPTIFILPEIVTGYEVCALMKISPTAHIAIESHGTDLIMGEGCQRYISIDTDENYACITFKATPDKVWAAVNVVGSWDPAADLPPDLFDSAQTVSATKFQHATSGFTGGNSGFGGNKSNLKTEHITLCRRDGSPALYNTNTNIPTYIDNTTALMTSAEGISSNVNWSSTAGNVTSASQIFPIVISNMARFTEIEINYGSKTATLEATSNTSASRVSHTSKCKISIDWETNIVSGTMMSQFGQESINYYMKGSTSAKQHVFYRSSEKVADMSWLQSPVFSLEGRTIVKLPIDVTMSFMDVMIKNYEAAEYTARPTVETQIVTASGPIATATGYLEDNSPVLAAAQYVDAASGQLTQPADLGLVPEHIPAYVSSLDPENPIDLSSVELLTTNTGVWGKTHNPTSGILPHIVALGVDQTVVRVSATLHSNGEEFTAVNRGFEYVLTISWSSGKCTITGNRREHARVSEYFSYQWDINSSDTKILDKTNLNLKLSNEFCNLDSMAATINKSRRRIEKLPIWRDVDEDMLYKAFISIEDSKTVSMSSSSSSGSSAPQIGIADTAYHGLAKLASSNITAGLKDITTVVTPMALRPIVLMTQPPIWEARVSANHLATTPAQFASLGPLFTVVSTGEFQYVNKAPWMEGSVLFTTWVYVRTTTSIIVLVLSVDDTVKLFVDGGIRTLNSDNNWHTESNAAQWQITVSLSPGKHRLDILSADSGKGSSYLRMFAQFINYKTTFPLREYQHLTWTESDLNDAFKDIVL